MRRSRAGSRPPRRSESEIDAAVRKGVREAYRLGLTGVHDFQRSGGFAAWQRLSADGALAFRVWASLPAERLDEALALGLRSGLGDEWIRIGPVKAFADGTLGSRTASMLEPYADGGTRHARCSSRRSSARSSPARAAAASMSPCTRSAIGRTATCWTRSRRRASCGAPPDCARASSTRSCSTRDDLRRFSELGVTASMQPSHRTTDLPEAQRAWGAERMRGAYAFAALHEDGAPLCFGSDAPIEDLAPLAGVRSARRGRPLRSTPRSTDSGRAQHAHATLNVRTDDSCQALRPTSSCSTATRPPVPSRNSIASR